MVWGSISFAGKACYHWGNVNAEQSQDQILQPVAIPYLHFTEAISIFQDNNTCSEQVCQRPPEIGSGTD